MGLTDPVIELPRGVKMLRTLEGHTGLINNIAFAPDGRVMASGSHDATVRLWEPASGNLLRILEGHRLHVTSVAFDSAGRMLASGSNDDTVRLWKPASGKLLCTLQANEFSVWTVAFDNTGRTLVTGSYDGVVRVWDPASGKLLRTLEGHESAVRQVVFDGAGRRLASGSNDGTVRLWDPASGKLLRTLEGHGSEVWSVAFEKTGRTLASGSGDTTLRLWDAASGKLLRILEGHTGLVLALAFSPDGALLASKSDDHTVRLWRCDTWEPVAVIPEAIQMFAPIRALAFSPTKPLLATGFQAPEPEDSNLIRLWEIDLAILLGESERVWDSERRAFVDRGSKTGTEGASVPAEVAIAGGEAAPTMIRRKRAANVFDVFLSYRSPDRAMVVKIGEDLKAQGILPWLDLWELRPGQPWQDELEKQIKNIKSVAVFLGNEPLARWQREEVRTFVSEFVDRNCAVIPVVLPDAETDPEMPPFLRGFQAIDFRKAVPDPLEQLIWGITGERPI